MIHRHTHYTFYIKNMLLHSATKRTPYERNYDEKPNLSFIKFGCKVYSFVEKQFREKVDERANVGVFLGFAEKSKTYIVGIEENGASKKIKTRSVKFNEDEFYFGT